MSQALWFIFAWIAGTAAILGSFMTLGSLLLWLSPTAHSRSRQIDTPSLHTLLPWQNRLKLLAFSVTIALVGLGILIVIPFPVF